ncbi:hypothetical protein BGZ91_008650, partial [Linnemannia elongata]
WGPPRIPAYRSEILHVIYAEWTQYQPEDAFKGEAKDAFEGEEDDDAMDDDDNDDNDDHGGYETDGDDEYGDQTKTMVDFSASMIE